jgi:hypothetical protein
MRAQLPPFTVPAVCNDRERTLLFLLHARGFCCAVQQNGGFFGALPENRQGMRARIYPHVTEKSARMLGDDILRRRGAKSAIFDAV